MTGKIYIDLCGISESFGPVQALEDVSFSIKRNEVAGLVGDNGAGKSTLIKILTSVHQLSAGELIIGGEVTDFDGYDDAQQAGIETVYQELAIAPKRTVGRTCSSARNRSKTAHL